jgi:hypothetical protein
MTCSEPKAAAEMIPSCFTCVYSDDGPSPADNSLGNWRLCRRHAPRALAAANDGFDGGFAIFPRVSEIDWCGEWISETSLKGRPKHRSFLDNELAVNRELEAEDGEA